MKETGPAAGAGVQGGGERGVDEDVCMLAMPAPASVLPPGARIDSGATDGLVTDGCLIMAAAAAGAAAAGAAEVVPAAGGRRPSMLPSLTRSRRPGHF